MQGRPTKQGMMTSYSYEVMYIPVCSLSSSGKSHHENQQKKKHAGFLVHLCHSVYFRALGFMCVLPTD